MIVIQCFKCQHRFEIDESRAVGRNEDCPQCGAFMRSCKMCRFYDAASYNECHEPMAERVKEKDRPNFCNYYQIGKGDHENTYDSKANSDAANALFKK